MSDVCDNEVCCVIAFALLSCRPAWTFEGDFKQDFGRTEKTAITTYKLLMISSSPSSLASIQKSLRKSQ